jgi:hypothetical protein
LAATAQLDQPPSVDRPMGRVKQSWQNFAVSLEHGTFFRSADGAVNSARFIAFYFSQSQTSIRLNPSNLKVFSEFFRMMDGLSFRRPGP